MRHTATKARTKTDAKQVAAELGPRAWRQQTGLEQTVASVQAADSRPRVVTYAEGHL